MQRNRMEVSKRAENAEGLFLEAMRVSNACQMHEWVKELGSYSEEYYRIIGPRHQWKDGDDDRLSEFLEYCGTLGGKAVWLEVLYRLENKFCNVCRVNRRIPPRKKVTL